MTTEADHPCAGREHIEAFVTRWKASGAAERANCQLFLAELCDILHTPRPEPTTPHDEANAYVFERSVTFNNGDGTTSPGRIDLYKRGCFVLEAMQGVVRFMLRQHKWNLREVIRNSQYAPNRSRSGNGRDTLDATVYD